MFLNSDMSQFARPGPPTSADVGIAGERDARRHVFASSDLPVQQRRADARYTVADGNGGARAQARQS